MGTRQASSPWDSAGRSNGHDPGQLARVGEPVHLKPAMAPSVLDPVRPTFRAVAVTVVPEAAQLGETQWLQLEGIVEQALALRPERMRRQLLVLIRLIENLPRLTAGGRFSRLDAARRTRFLERLQSAPLLLLRRGVWGLRTLVLMGYYARPEAAQAIGYRASAAGWAARRA